MSRTIVNFSDASNRDHAELPATATLHDQVIAALRSIYDPELPVNIYDLGLIYKLDIQGPDVDVIMTLTTPNCPVAEFMPGQVESAIRLIKGVGKVKVSLTWDPPWSMDKLTDEVKLSLGIL